MRCYRIKWMDIYGRERCFLVISHDDVSAENEISSRYKDFRSFVSTELLPFDRILQVE